jgi:hypothetical protein
LSLRLAQHRHLAKHRLQQLAKHPHLGKHRRLGEASAGINSRGEQSGASGDGYAANAASSPPFLMGVPATIAELWITTNRFSATASLDGPNRHVRTHLKIGRPQKKTSKTKKNTSKIMGAKTLLLFTISEDVPNTMSPY